MHLVQKRPMEGRIAGKRYSIGQLLRHTSSGDVYTCRDLKEVTTTLVIRIPPVSELSEHSEELSRRIVLLQKLQHPQIENVFDFGRMANTGELFLVSRHAEGTDFYSGTENINLPVVLTLFAEILGALQYSHTRGLIHGNLTPKSVLLVKNSDGRMVPLLRDFSLLHWSERNGGFNDRETVCYAAPELLLGGREGKETDLYALGILLYQSLTRRLPFENSDPYFVIQKQIQGNIDLGIVERMNGGESAVPVLERLLEKNPEKRIRFVDEALTLLQRQTHHDFNFPEEKSVRFSAAPFAEREEEMLRLLARVRQVKESERGWTVFIAGEAGSGKTRCMEELRGWAVLNGWRIAECAFSTCEESPYAPYMELLGKTDEVLAKPLGTRTFSPQILVKCGQDAHAPKNTSDLFKKEKDSFPEYISLVAETDYSGYGFAPGRFQDRLTRELVRHLSIRPTILLLHDIHLASKEACTILEYLCLDIRTHPIFICASFRADEISGDEICRVVNGARRGERGEIVFLNPLTKDGVRQIITGLTGINKNHETLCDWMFRTVGGNPLFVNEMLEHLAEHGILLNQSGLWKFRMPAPAKPDVPSAVGTIIRNRLARLSLPALETLEWLSLFSQAVPRKYMELLTAYDSVTNNISLEELDRYRLLRVEKSAGIEMFAPDNELIAEVAKEMITRKRKWKMYREIAELLEKEAGRDRLHEAALHYTESPPDDRSVRSVLAAVARFQEISAHENALRCFEYAFKYKNRLPTKEVIQAVITACDSMLALGDARRAIKVINSQLRSRSGIEHELKARLYLCLARAYRHVGEWRCQEQSCQTGLRMLRRSPVDGRFTETMLWTELAFSTAMRSRTRNVFVCLDQAMEACPDRNSPALFGSIQNLYALLYCARGEFEKAADAVKKAAAVLSRPGEYIEKCFALSALGLAHMKRGRFATALKLHLRAAALSEKSRSVFPRSRAIGKLAECLCRIGQIRKSFAAIDDASEAARKSNNPAMRHACDAVAAEINLADCNYRETRRILKTLECGEKQDISIFTDGCSNYISAVLNFRMGDFTSALDDIGKLRKKSALAVPPYEYELAEALGERIIFERDGDPGALERLRILESRVTRKRWPYHRCIIKLHICEIMTRLKMSKEAESYASNALRLARGMRSASLQCRAYLMLGIIRSPRRRAFSADKYAFADIHDAEKAICALNSCNKLAEASNSLECRWRALAELSFIHKLNGNYELCFNCARQAYKTLEKLEDRTPSDMLDSFRGVFGRGHIKMELAHLIEAEQPFFGDAHAMNCSKSACTGILLRMTEMVSSIREITPLLDELLTLALSAITVRRGLIFLLDVTTGKLEQAVGLDSKTGDKIIAEDVPRVILESVFQECKPLISADAGRDPRILKNSFTDPIGKLLCIPLKTSGRTIGVFYADFFSPVENIGEEEIDLVEAFCSLAALAVDNNMAQCKLTQTGTKSCFTQAPDPFPEIIGESPAIRRLKDRISLFASSPLDVLITGESGSGKELVARAICDADRKRNGKFIPVDSGALSDGIAEAELFGYRKGIFTGATEDRMGLLEAAGGGILFLDEISNMPLSIQVKLLRALQEREVRRMGETLPRKIEIRVVAATNKDIAEEIKNGRFCKDLFYRLRTVEIYTPPLRDRVEDIPLLIERFFQQIFDQEKGDKRRFSPDAMELLRQYSYPGNIRELKSIVSAAYYSSTGCVIEAWTLPPDVRFRKAEKIIVDSTAENLYLKILAGEGGFEDVVKKPYLNRCLGASMMRGVIKQALSDSAGVYRKAFERLRIPENRYASTMQFLKRHGCYLDFLRLRHNCE